MLILSCIGCFQPVVAKGPGIGNLVYAPNELFTAISLIESPKGHGNVTLVDGYLMTIYSSDGGGTSGDGGFDFWDVSNPRKPILFARHDNADTHGIREAHGFGLSNSYPGDYLVVQGVEGIQFWDVSDAANIQLLNYMDLPGIKKGDYSGDWWLFWQAPYVYVAGTGQGLYIVDANDPSNPQLVKQIPTDQLGGLNPGQVFVIGNLMISARNQNNGFASFDISNPINPVLLNTYMGNNGYSHLFASGTLLTSGGNGDTPQLYVHSINHDGQFAFMGAIGGISLGNGGYGSYQDGFFHSGFSNKYAKFQVFDQNQQYDLKYINSASAKQRNADEDFGLVLGNLVFVGNDHGASGLIVHQQEADLTGPDVHWVHPADGASNLLLSSRVGLSMSDNVDIDSITNASFMLRPVAGEALLGKYSVQMGIVNFSPDQALLANTTYEIVVQGMRDLMGNSGGYFTSTFTTGNFQPPTCTLAEPSPVENNSTVDFQAEVTSDSPLSSITWNFGDGSTILDSLSSMSASHSYLQVGRYNVVLTVENEVGVSSCSTVQIVHYPLTAKKPSASSSIIQGAKFIYNVNPDNNSVTAINKSLLQKAWEAQVGLRPTTLAIGPGGKLWVVNQESASVSILNPQNGDLIRSIMLPPNSAPHSIVVAADNLSIYVTLLGLGRLLKLDAQGMIVGNLAVGPQPKGLAITADSRRILVTRFVSATRDPNNLSYLPSGEVWEVAADPFAMVQTFELPFDPGPDTELSGRGVPNYLGAIQISPDGKIALIPAKKDNVARGQFYDGLDLTFESRTRAIISELDLVLNSESLSRRIDFNDRNMPSAVVFSPLGDIHFTALQGNNLIEVRETAKPATILTLLNTGKAPQGLVVDDMAQRLFVHNYLSRSVSVFDISALLTAAGNGSQILGEISTVEIESLMPDVLNGKRLFYDAVDPRLSADGYISCAGCHFEGGQDGQLWDFTQAGEGLRNTIALSGRAGTAQGRIHWTANFDEVQDFENDIRLGFGGTGLLTESDFLLTQDPLGLPKAGLSTDLDNLAAYVQSLNKFALSPYRNINGELSNQAQLGKKIFFSKPCYQCHLGENYTDGKKHDVGTIQASSGLGIQQSLVGVGFRTPTLKDVWKTAPYLHNGQAATLLQVLQNVTHVGELSNEEKLALVAYLQQIDGAEIAKVLDNIAPVFEQLLDVNIIAQDVLTRVVLTLPVVFDKFGIRSLSSDAPRLFSVGITRVTWVAIDNFGNKATATQKITLIDNTPPIILNVEDVFLDAESDSIVVDLGNVIADDNIQIASLENDAPNTFPVGETIVIWVATDTVGNQAQLGQTVTITKRKELKSDNEPSDIDVNKKNKTLFGRIDFSLLVYLLGVNLLFRMQWAFSKRNF